jgi:CDGSH-type Zn-finger protein
MGPLSVLSGEHLGQPCVTPRTAPGYRVATSQLTVTDKKHNSRYAKHFSLLILLTAIGCSKSINAPFCDGKTANTSHVATYGVRATHIVCLSIHRHFGRHCVGISVHRREEGAANVWIQGGRRNQHNEELRSLHSGESQPTFRKN